MNILFWNTYRNKSKKNIDDSLIELIVENDCDLIILAEYTDELNDLLLRLNLISKASYKILPNNQGCDHIKGLIKNNYRIETLVEDSRYQILKLNTTAYTLIIGAIHNKSKLNSSEDSQRVILSRMHQDIQEQEKNYNTKNSLIIGDFNINPFDKICVAADCLFAIPYKNELRNPTAVRDRIEYEKFYNPTWKFLSKDVIPYTSYRYDTGDIIDYYWNMFDQVIIRPILIDAFDNDSFKIMSKTRTHEFVYRDKPNKDSYSDHLPIFCRLKEDKIK